MVYTCNGYISNLFLLKNSDVQKNAIESYFLLRNRSFLEVHEDEKELMNRFIPDIIYSLYSVLITRIIIRLSIGDIKCFCFFYLSLKFRPCHISHISITVAMINLPHCQVAYKFMPVLNFMAK